MQAIIEDKAKEPGFTNSVVFNLVMRRNPDLCKGVVEAALGFELSKISYIETEKTIQPKLTSRNVRLDVVAKSRRQDDRHRDAGSLRAVAGETGEILRIGDGHRCVEVGHSLP